VKITPTIASPHHPSDTSLRLQQCPYDDQLLPYMDSIPKIELTCTSLRLALRLQAFSTQTLLLNFFFFFALQSLTFGTHIVAGIFVPTMIVGASLGGALGFLTREHIGGSWQPDGEFGVGIWSLMGAAGMLGGVQRTPVSLCVIVLEGTGQIKFLLPVIIVVCTATWIGNTLNGA
jgi:H+/Cl- antiporter ClcA